MKHLLGPVCPACEEKLKLAHPRLQDWFHLVKGSYPDIHVSWSFRSQAEQDGLFRRGVTKLKWPESRHNQQPSEAIDLFQITSAGIGIFDPVAMRRIYGKFNEGVVWGGNWKAKDAVHFELV